jgi:hypothetical protein
MRKNLIAESAQVSLDFIIGMSTFIVAIFFIYSILNSLFIPFQSTSDESKAMADRVSTVLVESPNTANGLANSASNPNILDKSNIVQLNNDLSDSNSITYQDKTNNLGLNTSNVRYKLNVSLRYFNFSIYPNESSPLLLAGEISDEYASTAQTLRFVYISADSQRLILLVKVWL